MKLEQPYSPRRIRMLELCSVGGWRMKLYGLSRRDDAPDPRLVLGARRLAAAVLPTPPVTEARYGVGFIGVHQGRGSNLVFVDWWERENELRHHVWVTEDESFDAFEYVTPVGLAACVWDLVVIGFERQAWVDAVLAATTPDVNRYLEFAIEGRF